MTNTQRVELFSPSRLRERRKKLGLSQEQAAERGGFKQAAISRYERGKVFPSVRTMPRLAKCVDATIADLLEPGDPTVERLRYCQALTMQDVARRLRISRNDYSQIEAGTLSLRCDLLDPLADILGVDSSVLAKLVLLDT